METIKIPGCVDIFVVKNAEDEEMVKRLGLPYVKSVYNVNIIWKLLLLPLVKKRFPGIDWASEWGLGRLYEYKDSVTILVPGNTKDEAVDESVGSGDWDKGINDTAESDRWFACEGVEPEYSNCTIEEWLGNENAYVDIEYLEKLNFLPAFMGTVRDCIERNFGYDWTEGYNKKLGMYIGTYTEEKQKPNLIIIDISGSIPNGIKACILSMIDSMRTRCQADLIITASRSGWYPFEEPLPSVSEITRKYGWGNESVMFRDILIDHVLGKEWGTVISFGDFDTPYIEYDPAGKGYQGWGSQDIKNLASTTYSFEDFKLRSAATSFEQVLNFHTRANGTWTGYTRWINDFNIPYNHVEFDNNWSKVRWD